MSVAAAIAIETDRIVTETYSLVGPRHRERLAGLANQTLGRDHVGVLPAINAELLSGPLPYAFVGLRVQYTDPAEAYRQVDALVAEGLLEHRDDVLTATDEITPLLEAVEDARGETCNWALGDQHELIVSLNETCHRVSVNAPGELLDYTRDVTEPDGPAARLLHRVMKVRYIRHQCHMDSWRAAGLEALQMPPFTALWNGEDVEPSPHLDALIERGLATDAPALTDEGRVLRDRIEHETNACAQAVFDQVLTAAEQAQFVSELQALEINA